MAALLLCSLRYNFAEALFVSTMLLPGAFLFKFFLPKMLSGTAKKDGEKSTGRIWGLVCLVLTVWVVETLMIVLANTILLYFRAQVGLFPEVPDMLMNPLFISLLLVVMCGGDYLLGKHLKERCQTEAEPITFISDRKRVSLPVGEILYVESNDTETWICATEGRKFRNKTPISQWENLLGEDYVRIHRSYLVRRSAIVASGTESVTVADGSGEDGRKELPVSRKYRHLILKIEDGNGRS